MKLAMFVLAGLLGATSLAAADDLPGDGGGDYYRPAPAQGPGRAGRPGRADRAGRAQLRQLLIQRFDANGDGRLEPRERRKAARALRRMAKRLGGQPGAMRERLIQKYDLDGDGNLGPGELPPRLARKLRRLDRNGDGWLDQRDQRDQPDQRAPRDDRR